jgi:hypothetical protein
LDIDFEGGTLAGFTSLTGTGCSASVAAVVNMAGAYGMAVVSDGSTVTYGLKTMSCSPGKFRVRFYFDPNSFVCDTSDDVILFIGYNSSSAAFGYVHLVYTGGVYKVHASIVDDSATTTHTSQVTISDGGHYIEVYWTSSATTGSVSMAIDGGAAVEVTGKDNLDRFDMAASIKLGLCYFQVGNPTGTLFFDDAYANDTGDEIGGTLPPPPPPDPLLNITHETGDLAQYTGSVTDSGDLSAHADAALVGSWGLKCVIDDVVVIYGYKNLTSVTGKFRARFYIDPNTLTMAEGADIIVFIAYNAASESIGYVHLRYYGGAYTIHATLVNNSSSNYHTGYEIISDASHYVEVYWIAGVADGSVTLYVDGVLAGAVTGKANATRFASLGSVKFGVCYFQVGTPTGTLYLDALKGNDTGDEIGA